MVSTVFALLLVFPDGYAGGHSTYAYFQKRANCERYGEYLVDQYTAADHPPTFTCIASKLPKGIKPIDVKEKLSNPSQ